MAERDTSTVHKGVGDHGMTAMAGLRSARLCFVTVLQGAGIPWTVRTSQVCGAAAAGFPPDTVESPTTRSRTLGRAPCRWESVAGCLPCWPHTPPGTGRACSRGPTALPGLPWCPWAATPLQKRTTGPCLLLWEDPSFVPCVMGEEPESLETGW